MNILQVLCLFSLFLSQELEEAILRSNFNENLHIFVQAHLCRYTILFYHLELQK